MKYSVLIILALFNFVSCNVASTVTVHPLDSDIDINNKTDHIVPDITIIPAASTTNVPEPTNATTPAPSNVTTPAPSNGTTPATTTVDPKNITTTTKPTTTTVNPNSTTTTTTIKPSPNTKTTTLTPPTTSIKPVPTNSTPTASTTPAATTVAPSHKDRHFDGPSFIGGIVLASGLMAIAFVAFKFYKARTERNYHTL